MSEQKEKRKRKGGDHRKRQDHPGANASMGNTAGSSSSTQQHREHHGTHHPNEQNSHGNSRKKRGRKNNNISNNNSTGGNNQNMNSNKNNIDSISTNSDNSMTLQWKNSQHMPLAVEEDMLKVILRWGERERGMLRDAPPFRLAEIQKRCHRHGIPLSQACSLRRHHMSLLNPYKSKESMQLGSLKDIKTSAELFEEAIAAYLRNQQIPFLSEEEQKAEFQRTHPGQLIKGTPDFKFNEPIILNVVASHENRANGTKKPKHKSESQHRLTKQRTIHWIEAKMFYGASTIPHDGRSAVGSILSKQKKYVKLYGEGAIVFSQGCGEKLAVELDAIGVTALGCIGNPDIDLKDLKRHQRTWCGDKNGNILP